MDTSKFAKEEEEEEEEWSSNGTGWTKYFRSEGSPMEEDDCGNETVEDDDSLASDASSGPADLRHPPCNRRSEGSEVKAHAKCMFEEEEEGHETQEAEKNKLGKKDRKKLEEKIKGRNVIKV